MPANVHSQGDARGEPAPGGTGASGANAVHRDTEEGTPAPGGADRGRPATPDPWYASGLRFQCTQCGNCCTGPPGFVWVTDEEIAAIAQYLRVSVGEVRLMHTRLVGNRVSLREHANGDCVFFDPRSRQCTIYAARPVQCRTWPFWRSNLASPEAWEHVKATCPGIGQGPLYSLEDIREQMQQRDV